MKKCIVLFVLLLLSCMPSWCENSAERTKRDYARLGLTLYKGNEVNILSTGEVKFRTLFREIDAAQDYVLMDYFKFQQDSICGILMDKLCKKAAEGVKVYVLYDSFANRFNDLPLSKSLLEHVRQSGIHIAAFDPIRFPWINHLMHRDHHKVAVIDGKVVYTGGMNVADYYLHGKPSIGKWRDMHCSISGPIVEAYEDLFWKMWTKTSAEPPLERSATHIFPSKENGKEIVFANRWPRESPEIMRQTYSIAIDNAEHLVQIVSPYAGLFGEVRAALRRALERGVRVQFMVSTKSDSKANDDVVGLEMRKLMKQGAEVYYFNGGFHHSKLMMVDSLFCTIGSTNLNARSLRFDYEVNAFIFDRETTLQLQQIYQKDIEEHCTLLTPEEWEKRFPPRRRARSRIFTLGKRFM